MRAILSEPDPPGLVADHAACILVEVVYWARMGRSGLLKVVATLATYITKWTAQCGIAVRRRMPYAKPTTEWTLSGYVGDPVETYPYDYTPTLTMREIERLTHPPPVSSWPW